MPQSPLVTLGASPQFLDGLEPVLVRTSLRAASGLPERIGQCGGVLVPKGSDAVFVHSFSMHLHCMLVCLLGLLKGPPGEFLAHLMVSFLMRFRGAPVSVGG
jgi:hypothetical protein